jgi:CrcB protein
MGSFLIGALFAVFSIYTFGDSFKSFLTAGFLGALTTYSTFAIESFFLLETSLFLGLSNMFLNLLGTVLAAGTGYKLLHFFIK